MTSFVSLSRSGSCAPLAQRAQTRIPYVRMSTMNLFAERLPAKISSYYRALTHGDPAVAADRQGHVRKTVHGRKLVALNERRSVEDDEVAVAPEIRNQPCHPVRGKHAGGLVRTLRDGKDVRRAARIAAEGAVDGCRAGERLDQAETHGAETESASGERGGQARIDHCHFQSGARSGAGERRGCRGLGRIVAGDGDDLAGTHRVAEQRRYRA